MTNQPPRELSTNLWNTYQTLSEELNDALEKIKRLEAMLERCKDQRDWWIHEKYEGAETKDLTELIDRENKNLESILEEK